MSTRRDFIKESALMAAGLAIAPNLLQAFSKAPKNIGIQLYTLREIIGKDVKGVIEKVAQTGFKEVETYGYDSSKGFWGLKAKEFKSLLDNNGLTSPSGHFGFENFINSGKLDDLKPYVEAANVLNSEYIVLPWLSEQNRKNIDSYKNVAERLNIAGEYCKKNGLLAGYHNHGFEFDKIEDTTGLDILLQNTDKNLVHFELDLYWAEYAKNSPIELFKKYPHRFKMWHIKDMDKNNSKWNTEIGNGLIDFKEIFAKAKLSGVKHFYLEQETNYKPNHLESIKTSFNYIKKELLT